MTGCVSFKYSQDNKDCNLGGSVDFNVIPSSSDVLEDVFVNL